MAVSDIDILKQRAEQVRDETANGANTADRIGGLLLDMVDTIVTRYGITELNGIIESDLNTQLRAGVYKYSIMKSGASKTDYGLLFVYSSDAPTSGSGDYPLYQTRFQGGLIQTRSRTMPNGLWSDWEEVGAVDENFVKNRLGLKVSVKSGKTNRLPDNYSDYIEDGWIDSNGEIKKNTNYAHFSLYIPIYEGETLYTNFSAGTNPQIALYGKDFSFISSVPSDNKKVDCIDGAYYARFSIDLTNLPERPVISSDISLPEEYNPVYDYIISEIKNEKLLSENPGINLYDLNSISPGYIADNGHVVVRDKYFHTGMLSCVEGDVFKANFSAGDVPQIAVYDKNKKPVYSVKSSQKNIEIPSGGCWVSFSIGEITDASDTSSYMIVKNRELPAKYFPYSPVGGYLNEDENEYDPFYKNTFIRSAFNCKSQMTFVETTFETGIFGNLNQPDYETSDYIPLSPNTEVNYYISWANAMTSVFTLARFYDINKKEIGVIKGDGGETGAITYGGLYSLLPPNGSAYIRYSNKKERNGTGLFSAPNKSLEETVKIIINETIGSGTERKILWTGTSIPAGATYPENSCEKLGVSCINKSIGASFICFDETPVNNAKPGAEGLSLSASVQEIEDKFRPSVTAGTITEKQLNEWKNASYENVILPYIDDVEAIVIDHGYNDRYDLKDVVEAGESSIDWDSMDRKTFIGAFNYIVNNVIWSRKPFMKIIVGGYFQNTWNGNGWNGEYICTVLEWISKHYSIPLLDTWKYAGMGSVYVPNSSDYISEYNETYGTSYTKFNPDENGNIMRLQLYCPDTVHPHSDKTGHSNKVLDGIFTKLLRDII